MRTGSRKRSNTRKKTSGGGPTTLTLIIILITVLAAALFYFFYIDQKPQKKRVSEPAVVEPAKKPSPATQNLLDGTWVSSNDGRILEIHGDRFSLERPSVSDHEITKGTLNIRGNTATILYTGTKDKCSSRPGVYTFYKGKKSIRFSVKQDVCAGRKQIFSTTWEKF